MSEVRESTPQWVSEFQAILAKGGVRAMDADHLTILSDYSSKGDFRTISFLVFDNGASTKWPALRRNLRERMPDNRRFSYKAMGITSQLYQFVDEFLEIADTLHGWLFTIAVSNNLRSLVADEDTLSAWKRIADLKGKWKDRKQFENVLRINLFLAVLLAAVIGETATLEWVSDQDDIFANDAKCTDVTQILKLSLGSFTQDIERRIVVGTSELDGGQRGIEDLLSIPDFAAGAVGDAATHAFNAAAVSEKTLRIAPWLSACNKDLRKFAVEFGLHPTGSIVIRHVQDELVKMKGP